MEPSLDFHPAKTAGLLVNLAPDQHAAIEKSGVSPRTWVSGTDVYKQIQVLVALCWSNALQGKTSLVCLTPELRGRVREALKSANMQGLYFDLTGQTDPAMIGAFQLARKKRAPEMTRQQAEVALKEYTSWNSEQEALYTSLDQVLFGELSWKDIVEQRCGATSSAYQHFLTASVKERFDLTHKEYWHIRGRIKSFSRLRTLRTPSFDTLEALNPTLFTDPDASLKDKICTQLQQIITLGREVLCSVADAIHAYRKDVTSDHQWKHNEIMAKLQHVTQLITGAERRFGQRFFDESTLSTFWQGIVRPARTDVQEMLQARQEIRDAFIEFHNLLQECADPHLDDVAAFMPDPLTVEAIHETCLEAREVMEDWTRRVDAHAAEHRKRINAQNVSRGDNLREMIRTAEYHVEEFTALMRDTAILNNAPEINALSLEKKAVAIENTVRLCMRLMDASEDIDAYTLWTNFWSAQHARTRAVLRCLDLMEDDDLVQAFDAWYFGMVLSQVPDHTIVSDRVPVQRMHPQQADLRAALEGHLRAQVQDSRHHVLREIATVQANLIQSIAKSQLSTFSEELRILPAKDLVGLFPVIMCNAEHLTEYGYYCDTLFVMTESGHDYKAYAAQSRHCVLFTQSPPKAVPESWQAVSLDIMPLERTNDWRSVPTSDRLPFLEALASQFVPFLQGMRVYNAKDIQIFSFLGERIDAQVLQGLGPYKEVGEQVLNTQHLVECFLDRRKPIAILLRDNKLGREYTGCLAWQEIILRKLMACGLHLCNLWSLDLKNDPHTAITLLNNDVRRVLTGGVPVPTHAESATLEHVRSGSHTLETLTEDPRFGDHTPGL